MKFVTASQLETSLELLRPHHPLLLYTIPAMCKDRVEPASDQATADALSADDEASHYGGKEESQFLADYTAVKGGPEGKPFYSPAAPAGKGWVVRSYATSSLQAQRKERLGRVFLQSGKDFYPYGKDWAEVSERLLADNLIAREDDTPVLVPLFALASWFFRDREFDTPADLIELARSELQIPDELIGTVYDDAIPEEAERIALGKDKLEPGDLAALVNAMPPPPQLDGGFADLISMIELSLKRRLVLGEDIAGQIVRAWAARDIVVLVGAGGTGKTTLAKGIVAALAEVVPADSAVEVPIDQEFTTSDLIGYENLAGEFVDRPLTARILRSANRLHPHVLLLEEANMTAIESYLGPILQAIESGASIQLSSSETVELPGDTLILATCNSPRDEPETRVPMSGPSKRRTMAIQMPNLLYKEWEAKKEEGLTEVIARLLANELEDTRTRIDEGRGTWLDQLRLQRLEAVQTASDLDETAGKTLIAVVSALLGSDEGRRWMTFGPLRDVVVQLVWAEPEDQPRVLGQLVMGKLLGQVQHPEIGTMIAESCGELPNAKQISEAAQDLAGPGAFAQPLI